MHVNILFSTLATLLLTGCGGSVAQTTESAAEQFMDARPAPLNQSNWDRSPAFREEMNFQNLDLARIQIAIYFATNEARLRNGLPAVPRHEALERTAQKWTDRMVARDFFDHTDPFSRAWRTPKDRLGREGVVNPMPSENIAIEIGLEYTSGEPVYPLSARGKFSRTPDGPPIPTHTYASFARDVVKGWMNSPGHRRNILDPKVQQMGGAATMYWQGNFPAFKAAQVFQLYEPMRFEGT